MAGFRNAERGLKIKGTGFSYLDEGAYSLVFVDRERRRIRKVYRNRSDADFDHVREVFEAETEAYAIASKADELKDLIPAYYGPVPGQTIIDASGNDVTGEFQAALAFEAEFVECSFRKAIAASHNERTRVEDLFRKRGIHHVTDISVSIVNGRITKVIDFAIKEVELWWKD